jgi:hypothetical protein
MDIWLGTEFLLVPGVDDQTIHDDLMIEFIYSAVAGVLAALTFELYIRRRATPKQRVPEEVTP